MIALILIPLGQCDEYHNRVALIIDILKGLLFAFVWFKVGVYFIIIYDEAFLILSTMTYLTLPTVIVIDLSNFTHCSFLFLFIHPLSKKSPIVW